MLSISASFNDACLICNIITLTENTVRWLGVKLYVSADCKYRSNWRACLLSLIGVVFRRNERTVFPLT